MCKDKSVPLEESAYLNLLKSGDQAHDPKLSLDGIRKSLPKEVFEKSIRRSIQWMIWDLAVVSAGMYLTKTYVYPMEMSMFKLGLLLLHYAVTGFFMWGIFVIGHDCGHGSFSNYPLFNHVCGLITHGSILVPFTAWARSHRFHHQNHNHEKKDFSFPWCHDPRFDSKTAAAMDKPTNKVLRAVTFPLLGYLFYLALPMVKGLGVDGCHYLPGVFSNDRLWRGATAKEKAAGWLDTAVVLGYLYFFTQVFCEGSLAMYSVVYAPAWIVFIFWLYTVTYLQHHNRRTKIYDDTTWQYTTAAFETVDREYGAPIDTLHHHISDCHVIHHLFFTSIPHYNLRKATDAMAKYLDQAGLSHLYQLEKTHDFALRVFQYGYDFCGRAKLITANSEKYGGSQAVSKKVD